MRSVRLDPSWHAAITDRVSCRTYDGETVAQGDLAELRGLAASLSGPEIRIVIVPDAPPEVYAGILGGYGKIVGARSLAAFVRRGEHDLQIGYAGEALILHAAALGVATCWVAGTFEPERLADAIDLQDGEVVRAVTPLGAPAARRSSEKVLRGLVRASKREGLGELAPGSAAWPEWAVAAAEAVRLAPSGGNRQPWRLRFEGDALVLTATSGRRYWTWEMDMGIAMLHAEVGAASEGVTGEWRIAGEPFEARFLPLP